MKIKNVSLAASWIKISFLILFSYSQWLFQVTKFFYGLSFS